MKNHIYQILAIGALCLATVALAVALWTSAQAQDAAPEAALAIPTTLNYQGHLREPDGSLTTGSYDISAKIYDLATGGDPLYTTTLAGVTVRDGLFNIVLGDDPPMPDTLFASAPLYIGISLDSNPELIPRQRLHAVPWAFQASTLVTNATVQGLTSNGDVTVTGATALNGSATVSGDTTIGGSATVSGDLTVTGNLAHPGEVFVGPHFLDERVELKSWGSCPATSWIPIDRPEIPQGATAVILEYAASENVTAGASIWVSKGAGAQNYRLAYVRAEGDGDAIGWAGQGTFPIMSDGSFQYWIDNNIQSCGIYLIGYYK